MTTLVYRYGLHTPTLNGDLILDQMRLAHKYRNDLVAFTKERREKSRALEGTLSFDLQEAEDRKNLDRQELDQAIEALNASRSVKRKRTTEVSTQLAEQVRFLRAKAKSSKESWQALRKKEREDVALIESRKELARAAAEKGKIAYRNYKPEGLSWGTRAIMDEAIEQANKMSLFDIDGLPQDPKMKRWCGEGSLAVITHQMGQEVLDDETLELKQKGFSVADIMSGTNGANQWVLLRTYSKPKPNPAKTAKVAAHRAKNAQRHQEAVAKGGGNTMPPLELSLRIGTDKETHAPIFASWPIFMHRPLPSDALIRRVKVHARKIGPQVEWAVDFTIQTNVRKSAAPIGSGAVVVDLGWLQTDGGLQVAQWMNQEGFTDTLKLESKAPSSHRTDKLLPKTGIFSAFTKVDDLKEIRKKAFNKALTEVADWFFLNGMPEWVRKLTVRKKDNTPTEAQAIAYLRSWKAERRLANLCRIWKKQGEICEGYLALEKWRYHDFHLWEWQSHQEKSNLRRRQTEYRRFAADLASKYETLVIGDTNYAKLARNKTKNAEGAPAIDPVNSNRFRAAPGEFRTILEQAFQARGGTVERRAVQPTCPACGNTSKDQVNNTTNRVFACVSCPYEDSEVNNTQCLNLLASAGFTNEVAKIIEKQKELAKVLRAG